MRPSNAKPSPMSLTGRQSRLRWQPSSRIDGLRDQRFNLGAPCHEVSSIDLRKRPNRTTLPKHDRTRASRSMDSSRNNRLESRSDGFRVGHRVKCNRFPLQSDGIRQRSEPPSRHRDESCRCASKATEDPCPGRGGGRRVRKRQVACGGQSVAASGNPGMLPDPSPGSALVAVTHDWRQVRARNRAGKEPG